MDFAIFAFAAVCAAVLLAMQRRGRQWREAGCAEYRRRVLRGDLDNGRDNQWT